MNLVERVAYAAFWPVFEEQRDATGTSATTLQEEATTHEQGMMAMHRALVLSLMHHVLGFNNSWFQGMHTIGILNANDPNYKERVQDLEIPGWQCSHLDFERGP